MTGCDLCGDERYHALIKLDSPRAMYSDRRVVRQPLQKVECQRCGLVRSSTILDPETLERYYSQEYTLSTTLQEHYFYTTSGKLSRSEALCEWLVQAMGAYRWGKGKRCLEVGAGDGKLLKVFQERLPELHFEGIELNEQAVALAQSQGLNVDQKLVYDLPAQQYDIIYSIAVLEHVASPSAFLAQLRAALKPGGLLFLCQPTQDVASYDLFFFDHVHHFGTAHLRGYARKCGFKEVGFVVGHEWMPNFSLHCWQLTADPADQFHWEGMPGETTCQATAQRLLTDFDHLNLLLANLRHQNRRVAVFGLAEAFWVISIYSNLNDFPIVCGLDDQPDKPEYNRFSFPVISPEASLTMGVQDVVLTMNKVYYPLAATRLEKLGLRVHPVFT